MNTSIKTIFKGFSERGIIPRRQEFRFADTVEEEYRNAVVTKLARKPVVIFFNLIYELSPYYPTEPKLAKAIRSGNVMRGAIPESERAGFAFFVAEETLKVRSIDVPLTDLPDNFKWEDAQGCIGRIDNDPFGLEPFDMSEFDKPPFASFLFPEDKDAIFFRMRMS